jgi:hypothetical protein
MSVQSNDPDLATPLIDKIFPLRLETCGMPVTIPVILSAAKDLMAVANGIPLEMA